MKFTILIIAIFVLQSLNNLYAQDVSALACWNKNDTKKAIIAALTRDKKTVYELSLNDECFNIPKANFENWDTISQADEKTIGGIKVLFVSLSHKKKTAIVHATFY